MMNIYTGKKVGTKPIKGRNSPMKRDVHDSPIPKLSRIKEINFDPRRNLDRTTRSMTIKF